MCNTIATLVGNPTERGKQPVTDEQNHEPIEILPVEAYEPPEIRRSQAQALSEAANWLLEADGLLITAGAGMGVDSGLPDFRGDQGLWKHYPALGRQSLGFADIANPRSFEVNPRLAWGFYGHRLALYRDTRPHEGFDLLWAWAERMEKGAFVFTSNVDGHFRKAGFPPDRIVECHGSIHHLQCTGNCSGIWPADDFRPQVDTEQCLLQNDAPVCPDCGRLARPNILMFGDAGWVSERSGQQRTNYDQWIQQVENPLVIEIGAGTHIPTVRHESERRSRRGRLVRINPREPGRSGPETIAFPCAALDTLRKIDAALRHVQ